MVTGKDPEGLEAQVAEATSGSQANVRKFESGFVRAAAGYSARHGMTYESWRQAGVDPEVLAQAGIRGPADVSPGTGPLVHRAPTQTATDRGHHGGDQDLARVAVVPADE